MKIFKTTQSDLIKYNNMKCIILNELKKEEYDKEETGVMYNIKLENGIKIQAFSDEIQVLI